MITLAWCTILVGACLGQLYGIRQQLRELTQVIRSSSAIHTGEIAETRRVLGEAIKETTSAVVEAEGCIVGAVNSK